MSTTARTRVVAAAVAALVLVACSGSPSPPPPSPTTTPADSIAARSQQALDDLVADDAAPGCTAAVGERGTVVWQGVSGLAEVESGTALTPESLVDVGSVAKQFTATALLLLEHEGRLSLDDRLSEHLDDLPEWAGEVTLGQLMRHTSGITEVTTLLELRGITQQDGITLDDELAALRELTDLDFRPGSDWRYSNSNYLLLGLVLEEVSGEPLVEHLDRALFRPLTLVVQPTAVGSGYRRSTDGFERLDWRYDVDGGGGFKTSPSTLVRWADSYRTGAPAGSWLNDRRLADAADVGVDGNRYGAGVVLDADGLLAHPGANAGSHSVLVIAEDRQRAMAITCLQDELDPQEAAVLLSDLWFADR
jgi:CubicO group peptidase (beta-lactamase class C family)